MGDANNISRETLHLSLQNLIICAEKFGNPMAQQHALSSLIPYLREIKNYSGLSMEAVLDAKDALLHFREGVITQGEATLTSLTSSWTMGDYYAVAKGALEFYCLHVD